MLITDLDGTLLDHDSYQPGPASGALQRLQGAGVPVVFCSSKTRAEQRVHRDELAVTGPFIVENGAAVFGDGTPLVTFGLPYGEVRARLQRTALDLTAELRGYGDMPLVEIVSRTGLSPAAAERARAREFTEPFVLPEPAPAPEALATAAARHGLRLHRGSRFWTASGDHDKGLAVDWLRTPLATDLGRPPTLFGVGDAANDLEMLRVVDVPMLVARPDGSWADLQVDGLIRLSGVGPRGWCEAVDRVLDAA